MIFYFCGVFTVAGILSAIIAETELPPIHHWPIVLLALLGSWLTICVFIWIYLREG